MNSLRPLLVLTVLTAAWSPVIGQELLVNPGFEQAAEGQPATWRITGQVSLAAPAHSGKTACRLAPGARVLQCFSLQPQFLYQASVWARGKGNLTLAFYEYRDGPGQNYAGAATTKPLPLTDHWQQFHLCYSQGPNEAHLKGLCFALAADKNATEVLIDDASVQKTALPETAPNLLANPAFSQLDGHGLPRGWHGEPRRLRLESGPAGLKALRCDATLFSSDYQPAPNFADWWSWARWGEQHGSGWPALPRPLGGAYTVLLTSDPAPVHPGRRYDAKMSLRELEAWGEFVGVRWLDAKRKPLAEFEERIGYYHPDGSSADWTDYTGRVTSPQAARFAAVVLGVKLSSGAIWVCRPSLTAGLGAPYRHQPRSERHPSALKQGVPQATTAAPPALKAAVAVRPGVTASGDGLTIGFNNGMALKMPLRDGHLIGITQVSCEGVLLRSPQAPPVAPVVETIPARVYSACLYRSYDTEGNQVTVHSLLVGPGGTKDQLDWILAPAAESLGGQAYRGLSYAYRFSGQGVRVRRLMDRATWEAGGHSLGLRVGSQLLPLGPSSTFCLQIGYRFVESDSFDYETGPAGTLVSYLDHYQTDLQARAATPDFIILQDTFLFPDVPAATTTAKHVLFRRGPGGYDDWAAVRDQLYSRFRRQLGAPPERPLQPAAMVLGWGHFKGIGSLHLDVAKPTRPQYYRWVADQAVPKLAELGFKRVMMVLGMAPWDWPQHDINDLGPAYVTAFKYLCAAAHRHGMGVISWYGTCQNLDGAAVWQQHPEFILWGPGHQRSRTYYSPWGWPGKLAAGFADYTLQRLATTRRETGLDGLWLDSYSSATHLLKTDPFSDSVHQADGLLPWQARIEAMGYYTYCEGYPSCLGYPSTSGWRPPEDWSRFHAAAYYKQTLYLQQAYVPGDMPRFLSDPRQNHYYRFLANDCCPILDLGHFGDDQQAIALIARANHDFNAVCDLMQKRHLLGEHGVEWLAKGGRAVYAFEAFQYGVPAGLQMRDVTAGQQVRVPRSRLVTLTPYHTYRLTPGAL